MLISQGYLQSINGKEVDVYLRKRVQSGIKNNCMSWMNTTPSSMAQWVSGDYIRGQILIVAGTSGNPYGVIWAPTSGAAKHAVTGATEPAWATAITGVGSSVVDGSGSWTCKWAASAVRAALVWYANQVRDYPDAAVNTAMDIFGIDYDINGVNSKWRMDVAGNSIDDGDFSSLCIKMASWFAAITLTA
jgi:hypothetical protein